MEAHLTSRWPLRYDGNHTYVVNFRRRPLGMLVEDRGGVCTVVELQNEEDGRIGQAACNGVMVDDAIISLGGIDVRRMDFAILTERIRGAAAPFTIGFARHANNLRALTPPPTAMGLGLPPRYAAPPARPSGGGGPLPILTAAIPPTGAREWLSKLPQQTSTQLIRPRAVVPTTGGGGGSSGLGPSTRLLADDGKRSGKRSGEEEDAMGALRRVKPRAPGAPAGSSGVGGGPAREANTPTLNSMLEDYGRRVIMAFLEQPQEEEEKGEEEEEEGGGEQRPAVDGEGEVKEAAASSQGRKKCGQAAAVVKQGKKPGGASESSSNGGAVVEGSQVIETAKLRYKRVRQAVLESRQASSELYEYSRALLQRGEAMERLESRVTELMQVRAIEVREKVQDLRALESSGDALRVKWTEVNEQRSEQLQFKRLVLDRSLTELERLVTDGVPKACRRVEAELQLRLSELEQLLTSFHNLHAALAPPDEPLPAPPGGAVKVEGAAAAASRPHLLSAGHHHHHHHGSTGSLGERSDISTPPPPEYKPPKLGPEFQLSQSCLPMPWSHDPSLTLTAASSSRLSFVKDGEELCRWKPPPAGQVGMPTDEQVAELVSSFRPELEETVLWELYKRGWDVSSTLTAVKQQLVSGTLKKETPVEPLSRTEVPFFDKAMAERWKDFSLAARMLGRKHTRGCVVHYYNHFKRSEAYKRLRPRSDSPESLPVAPPPPPPPPPPPAATSGGGSSSRRTTGRG